MCIKQRQFKSHWTVIHTMHLRQNPWARLLSARRLREVSGKKTLNTYLIDSSHAQLDNGAIQIYEKMLVSGSSNPKSAEFSMKSAWNSSHSLAGYRPYKHLMQWLYRLSVRHCENLWCRAAVPTWEPMDELTNCECFRDTLASKHLFARLQRKTERHLKVRWCQIQAWVSWG